jgi:hypothetical protein
MADVSFTPTFRHTPWVDNRDRVQASGPNGFNVRFAALEADLQTISGVVTDIDVALDTLEQTPAARTHILTIPPNLQAVSTGNPWTLDPAGYAVRAAASATAYGIAPVVLPDGVTLASLRGAGQNSGTGTLRINLMRARLLGVPAPAERIARVAGDGNPFDNQVAVDPGLAPVDTSTFRYFVLVTLDGSLPPDTVSLSGFQITYLA